jgi:hypothetical protein
MTDRTIPDQHWKFLPIPLAVAGPSHGFVQVMSGRWWCVHPEKGLRFYNPGGRNGYKGIGAPQCNSDKRIMDRLCHTEDALVYLERVFVPIQQGDYHG